MATNKDNIVINDWLASRGYQAFAFQQEAWQHIQDGKSGLVNAPTGCGKTFSVFLGAIIQFINEYPKDYTSRSKNGLQLLWITPLRALAKDIGRAMEEVISGLGMQWKVGIRNGDTSLNERARQKTNMPEVLIITPESLHLMLAMKDNSQFFKRLRIIAVDEWHELLGSKRGVQVELAISRLVGSCQLIVDRIVDSCLLAVDSKKDVIVDGRQLFVDSNEKGYDDNKAVAGKKSSETKNRNVTNDATLSTNNCQLSTTLLPTNNYQLPTIQIWGISATIGNLDEAREVLLSTVLAQGQESVIVKARFGTEIINEAALENERISIHPEKTNGISSSEALIFPTKKKTTDEAEAVRGKRIAVHSIIPDEIEKYPWAGHLGIKLAHKIVPIIEQSNTTLIFINTRGMSERWYQTLLDIAPQFAGAIALHHGSIEQELRTWVEESLHTQRLKAVVCTASLDLGVDFRPVDTVIQVGSPKGVARFLQRAGRASHQPGAVSNIYFLPTHSLELVESAALQQAIADGNIESKLPMQLCFDVLVQYLCTLAVGEGFKPEEVWQQVKSTYCYRDMTDDEWQQLLLHITEGGRALKQYDEFKKVEIENGIYKIKGRRIAMRHRLHIGTIVSDAMLKVRFLGGGYIGVIEEYFISRLEPGDVFTLAGRNVELVQIKDMTVYVRKSTSKKTIVPSWNGGRMSLTANLGQVLRETFNKAADITRILTDNPISQTLPVKRNATQRKKLLATFPPELRALAPLFQLQEELSHIPRGNELLIEHIEDKDGYHLMVYPFEGRQVHEAMSAILAYRIGQIVPISFSIAMNDYGFELLSDQPIPLDDTNAQDLFSADNLLNDMQRSTNSAEMAMRKFRDIAVIGGLIFQGMPGEHKKARHLQSSASLLFKVFRDYDPDNILMRQAYHEVYEQQMEEIRLRNALSRIHNNPIIIKFPERLTPLCFPILVDGLSRMNLTTERLEDRIKKMQAGLDYS